MDKKICCLVLALLFVGASLPLVGGAPSATGSALYVLNGSAPEVDFTEETEATVSQVTTGTALNIQDMQSTIQEMQTVIQPTPIVQVTVPTMLDFIIDPWDTQGRGQVFSEPHVFENHGESAVTLSMSALTVHFAQGRGIIPVQQPFAPSPHNWEKSIFMQVNFSREYIPCVVLTTSPAALVPSINLGAAGTRYSCVALTVSGNVTPFPLDMWQSGDVSVSLVYVFEPKQEEAR